MIEILPYPLWRITQLLWLSKKDTKACVLSGRVFFRMVQKMSVPASIHLFCSFVILPVTHNISAD